MLKNKHCNFSIYFFVVFLFIVLGCSVSKGPTSPDSSSTSNQTNSAPTIPQQSGDIFEPDNNLSSARSLFGKQERSLHTLSDVDWIKFKNDNNRYSVEILSENSLNIDFYRVDFQTNELLESYTDSNIILYLPPDTNCYYFKISANSVVSNYTIELTKIIIAY